VLGPSGVGVASVINTTLSLSLIVAALALPQAFFRWYLKEARGDGERAHVLATTLTIRLVASLLALAAVSVAVVPLTRSLYGDDTYLPAFLVIGPILLFDSLLVFPLLYLRARHRPRPYAAISFTRVLVGSSLIVALVAVVGLGVMGVVVGSAVAAAVSAAAGFALLWRSGRLRLAWDLNLSRRMLAFSLPLVPAGVAGWALIVSDRYILQALTDADVVGIYAMGYTVGMVIGALAVHPFAVAWGTAYWELARRPDASEAFGRVMLAFAGVAGLLALGLSALGTDAIRLLVGPQFELSRYVVPFSSFGYVLWGIFTIGTAGLNIQGQTRWVPAVLIPTAVVSVGLNLILIPRIGFMGAAVSTIVSYALLAVVSTAISQRYFPVHWPVVRLGLLLGAGFLLAGAALLGPDQLLWRLACVVAYLPVLAGLRVVSRAEVRSMAALVLRSRR
jgi:O-antigen/teichoic acid export membrane protein